MAIQPGEVKGLLDSFEWSADPSVDDDEWSEAFSDALGHSCEATTHDGMPDIGERINLVDDVVGRDLGMRFRH